MVEGHPLNRIDELLRRAWQAAPSIGVDPDATSIDISFAGGYGPGMTTALFTAAPYYAPLS